MRVEDQYGAEIETFDNGGREMVSPRVLTAEDAAEALLEHGYAIAALPDELLAVSDSIIDIGRSFFLSAHRNKVQQASADICEGYLAHGVEKDKRTGRPDLHESYKVWFRNQRDPLLGSWVGQSALHKAMREGLGPHADFCDVILGALRRRLDPSFDGSDSEAMDIRSETCLQMNFSRPQAESRDTISDTHEDGFILTMVRPSDSGFMACPGKMTQAPSTESPAGNFEPDGEMFEIESGRNEVILVPSIPTYFLTGGAIRPLFHKVATTRAAVRESLLFFANPTRSKPLDVWKKTAANDTIKLRDVIDELSATHLKRHGWEGWSDFAPLLAR